MSVPRNFDIPDQPERDERHFWEMRVWLQDAMQDDSELSGFDFHFRFWRKGKRSPVLLFTTVSFIEAVAASIWIDRLEGAKVRKCARKDCGVLFSDKSLRKKKYCS
jgi:hypothetical protein